MKKATFLIVLSTTILKLYSQEISPVTTEKSLSDKNFFIENKGQWQEDVLFLSQTKGMDVWLTSNGIIYDFYQSTPVANQQTALLPDQRTSEYSRAGQVIRWEFNGERVESTAEGKGQKDSYYNYFKGNNPSEWATNVRLYEEVMIENVFNEIDLHYYFEEGNIRYDYVVHPGADVSAINLSASGTDELYVENGDLMTRTRFGDVAQGKLFAYQIINGIKKEVPCDFIVTGKTVTFAVGAYDKSRELIIDPLIWSTFIGGALEETVNGMSADASNNIYLTGSMYSTNYPSTVGAYDITQNGGQDAYLTKLSANGNALIYSTFFGGSGIGVELGYSVTVDASGNAYVTGVVGSSDFPATVGAFDVSANGTDVFVTKFNSLGNGLVYSTFLGGNGQDYGLSITIDATLNAYVTGYTNSGNFPVTVGVYDANYTGNTLTQDVFVTKLNATGSALIFSTYLGGNGSDYGNSIAVDASGNVYVTGSCSNAFPLFPATFGSYDDTQNGGDDVFVAKFNPTATALVFSTFIGGTTNDAGTSIAVDASNNIFVAGYAASVTFPVTIGAFDQSHNSGIRDAFILKLNAAGTSLIYSTFVGGSGDDRATSLAINSSGVAYFCGITTSTNFPTTVGSHDEVSNGGWDGYVAQLNATGSALVYSSFFGGTGNDFINAIRDDGNGGLLIAGGVTSSDLPTTIGSYDQTYNGGAYDIAVAKFCTPPIVTASANTPLCAGQTLNLSTSGGSTYSWSGPNGFTSSLQNPVLPNVNSSNAGTYSVLVTTSGGCSGTATVNVTIGAQPVPVITSNGPLCAGQTLNLTATGGVSYSWSGPNGFNSALQNPSIANTSVSATGTYSVTVTGSSGCTAMATLSVTINTLPVITATSNSPVCEGSVLNLSASGAASYSWSGPNTFSSAQQNPSVSNVTLSATGTYTVSGTGSNGCIGTGSVSVNISSLPFVSASSNSPLCSGSTLNLQAAGGNSYNWNGPGNFSSNQQTTAITNASLNNAGVYTVTVTNSSGCINTGTVAVVVNSLPSISVSNNSPVCEGQSANFTANGGTSYSWSGPNNFTSTMQNPIISNTTLNGAGNYSVVVTDANGCTGSAIATLFVNALPIVNASGNSPVCLGQAILFSSSSGVSYSWTGPGTFNSNQQSPSIPGSSNADAGTYYVQLTDTNGCTNTDSVNINIIDVIISLSSNSPSCNGDPINLNAGGGTNYSWSGPDNFNSAAQNPVIINGGFANTGTYTVTVTDANGCVDTASMFIQVITVDTAAFVNGAMLSASASGANYQWINCANNSPIPGATNQNYMAPQNGQYAVIVTENGCSDTSSCLNVFSVDISQNVSSDNIAFGPNPVETELFILSASPVHQITVYSSSGALIFIRSADSLQTVDVSDLAAGIYFIEFVTQEGVVRNKFIKN